MANNCNRQHIHLGKADSYAFIKLLAELVKNEIVYFMIATLE